MTNPLVALGGLGQSPWYDYITRDLVRGGELARLIAEDGLLGMTSNPTIFEKAVSGSALYDDDIRRLAAEGRTAAQIFEALAVADVQEACDAFAGVHRGTKGVDGLVSLEVSPTLAHDTEATVAEARRLWAAVDRPNAMIKIPGTLEGLPAVTRCLADGINVNVTLLFSVDRYRQVIEAFLQGVEQAAAARPDAVGRLASVASFFVSRLDGKVDSWLDANGGARALRGTAAIANACAAYAVFQDTFCGPRWEGLAARGARVQRPLWASTSTKDPAYPDVYYVEALVAAQTVNTLPPATFDAYRDHGQPNVRIGEGMARAPGQLQALADAGIDLAAVTHTLEVEGVKSFAKSYADLLAGIEAKAGALAGR
ncbi:MAG TPA: transaldolase [Gemmatimonadales bacterium]